MGALPPATLGGCSVLVRKFLARDLCRTCQVAVAGDQADLIAEPEPVGGGRNREPAVLVAGALIGRGGLVTYQRRPRVERQRLEAGIDNGTVPGRRLITVAQT
jgi:hypothetical protein